VNEHAQQQLFGERHRPELSAALDYIRAGDTLVVWKLDHLARSMRQLIETIEDLHARSPRASTPPRRVGGWCSTSSARLNEFERAVIRERRSAGLQAAHERGKKGARPRTLGLGDLAAAKALLADPAIRVEDVAARLKVSPATLYRHLPGGRSAVLAKGEVERTSAGVESALLVEGTTRRVPLTHILSDLQTPQERHRNGVRSCRLSDKICVRIGQTYGSNAIKSCRKHTHCCRDTLCDNV
jgi:Resolvase, N terminal domain/Helix-turn-helix domain of resolvase